MYSQVTSVCSAHDSQKDTKVHTHTQMSHLFGTSLVTSHFIWSKIQMSDRTTNIYVTSFWTAFPISFQTIFSLILFSSSTIGSQSCLGLSILSSVFPMATSSLNSGLCVLPLDCVGQTRSHYLMPLIFLFVPN